MIGDELEYAVRILFSIIIKSDISIKNNLHEQFHETLDTSGRLFSVTL